MGKGIWKTVTCMSHHVYRLRRWLPGADSPCQPQPRTGGGTSIAGAVTGSGVPAERLVSAATSSHCGFECGLSLPQGGLGHSQERAACAWCAWRVILAIAYNPWCWRPAGLLPRAAKPEAAHAWGLGANCGWYSLSKGQSARCHMNGRVCL